MNKQVKLDAFVKENLSKDIEESRKGIQGSYDLPNGWKWVRLDAAAWLNKEKRDPRKEMPNEEFLYIDISSIEEGTGSILEVKKILGKNAPSRARRVIHANDVIMSTVRPYLKSIAIIPEEYDNQICSTGFAVLTCKKEILPKYLFYLLFSDVVIRQCNEMMVGAHYPALRFDQVARIKIPLPPLEEQKRIVSRLDQLVSRAEEAKRLRKLAREEAEKIMHAALNKVFSRAEEEGWKWVRLKELVLIESGKRPKGGSTGTGVPSLGGEQLLPTGKVNWEKLRYVPEDFFDTLKKGKVKQGDVLVVKDGATTGKTAYVESLPFKKVAVNEHVFIVRSLDESRLLNKYLFFILFSEIGQKQIRDLFHGAAQGGITQHNVEEISIPLPTLDEQKRIIVYLDKLRETIVSIRGLQQKTEEELEKLVPSILDKAFKGGL
jgi:type I restriction enzyme S subunit